MRVKSILYRVVFVVISLVFLKYIFKAITLFELRDDHYTKIEKSFINGRIADIAEGRYTSIKIDNIWYDVAVKKFTPHFAAGQQQNFFEINDRIFKKANNDTFLLVKNDKVYTCTLP